MQLTTEEFDYYLGKIMQDGYQRGYQQGQKDLINKQQAAITNSAGPVPVTSEASTVDKVTRRVPRAVTDSPSRAVDDSF